jgi:hypothetical protein
MTSLSGNHLGKKKQKTKKQPREQEQVDHFTQPYIVIIACAHV